MTGESEFTKFLHIELKFIDEMLEQQAYEHVTIGILMVRKKAIETFLGIKQW